MTEAALPNDIAAEQALLGAVLLDESRLDEIAGRVSPGDYWRTAHRHIWSTMLDLRARGSAIDPFSIDAAMNKRQRDEVGGRAYIASLVDGLPRAVNVTNYAEIVRVAAIAREQIRLLERDAKRLRESPASAVNGLPAAHAEQWQRLALAAQLADQQGLDESALIDGIDVAAEGQQIARDGIPQLIDGLIPAYGMLGFIVAYAKVGKSTFTRALSAAVATGAPFLERAVQQARVLTIAAEDPPEYVAYLARHLNVPAGAMTYYRRPIILDTAGLRAISQTVQAGAYGLVVISSWQAVIRGLVRDENDNAGAVAVVEAVKAATRETGVPWLIEAHSGKGEDQDDDADPSRAMRGASAAAGAADYALSLRYLNGAFGTQRRLSGKGRFVALDPVAMEFDSETGVYSVIGSTKDVAKETTWRIIRETGAVTTEPRSAAEVAIAAGLVEPGARVTGARRRQVAAALSGRPDILRAEQIRRGQKTTVYQLVEVTP